MEDKVIDDKLGKLDDAFLFVLASLGIVISFITSFVAIDKDNFTLLVSAVPFLLLGVLLPFFIGYIRGAISERNIQERIRGWLYFLIGTTTYFGFFLTFLMTKVNYYIRETIFLTIVAIGLVLAYKFIKWSKNQFRFAGLLTTYSFSATSLGALVFSFSVSSIIGNIFDIINSIIIKPTSFTLLFLNSALFFAIVIFFSVLFIILLEKASRSATQLSIKGFDCQQSISLSKISRFKNNYFVKGTYLGLVLFEYTFDYCLEARTLWIQSFAYWIIGFFFWIFNLQFIATIFFILTIAVFLIGSYFFNKKEIDNFEGLEKVIPLKVSLGLGIVLVVMIFPFVWGFNLFADIIVFLICLLLIPLFWEINHS
jgi:hypothetical protein